MATSAEICCLVCGDWHGPACAIDSSSNQIRYANLPLQKMVLRGSCLQIHNNRLELETESATQRLYEFISAAAKSTAELTDALECRIDRSRQCIVSIFNPQGVFRNIMCSLIAENSQSILFVRFKFTNAKSVYVPQPAVLMTNGFPS